MTRRLILGARWKSQPLIRQLGKPRGLVRVEDAVLLQLATAVMGASKA